jgi:GTP:adenosylcobinamide-phosphate guanylyltransferase
LPKPLVKVKGKALLEYVLEAFIDSGIKESPAKSRNSQITACRDRRTANDFK